MRSYINRIFIFLLGILFLSKSISKSFLYLLRTALPYLTCRMLPKKALELLFELENIIENQINAVAIIYGGGKIHPKHRLTRYHDFFVDRVKPDDTVLDIGCGIGAVSHSIAGKLSCQILGIDASEGNIKDAKQLWKHPKLSFIVGKAPEDLPEKVFSVVILSNVLEHIEDRVYFLKEIKRKIKPQKILIRVPSYQRDWKIPLKDEIGISYFNDSGHYIEYTEEGLKSELKAVGYFITEQIIRWGEIWAEAVPVDSNVKGS